MERTGRQRVGGDNGVTYASAIRVTDYISEHNAQQKPKCESFENSVGFTKHIAQHVPHNTSPKFFSNFSKCIAERKPKCQSFALTIIEPNLRPNCIANGAARMSSKCEVQ